MVDVGVSHDGELVTQKSVDALVVRFETLRRRVEFHQSKNHEIHAGYESRLQAMRRELGSQQSPAPVVTHRGPGSIAATRAVQNAMFDFDSIEAMEETERRLSSVSIGAETHVKKSLSSRTPMTPAASVVITHDAASFAEPHIAHSNTMARDIADTLAQ